MEKLPPDWSSVPEGVEPGGESVAFKACQVNLSAGYEKPYPQEQAGMAQLSMRGLIYYEDKPDPISGIDRVLGEFQFWLDRYETVPKEQQESVVSAIKHVLTDPRTEVALGQETCSDDALGKYIDALASVQSKTDIYCVDQLAHIPLDRLRHESTVFSHVDTLFSIAAQAIAEDPETEIANDFATTFTRVAGDYYGVGRAFVWRNQQGQMDERLPEYMRSFVERPEFVHTALNSVRSEQREGETNQKFLEHIRTAERILLERYTPIVGELSSRFRYSLDARTMKLDSNDHVIPMAEPEGGVDFEKWKVQMEAAIDSTLGFTPDELRLLYEKAGIVNFDRPTREQLRRNLKLHQGDKETIDRLKQGDTSLLISDAYGCHNGALDGIGRTLETDNQLMCEISHPMQLYRFPVSIARKIDPEFKFSSLAIGVHGGYSTTFWGREAEDNEMQQGSKFVVKAGFTFPTEETPNVYLGQALGITRFLRKYMRPHSRTGERHVTFISCEQGVLRTREESIPEVIIGQTIYEDRVVIRAMCGSGNVRKVAGRYEYYSRSKQQRLVTREFRALSPDADPDPQSLAICQVKDREHFDYV